KDGIRDFHVTGVQTCALPIFSLPTYPFEGRRYSVAPNRTWARRRVSEASARRAAEINDWFWLPSWQRSAALPAMPRGHVPGRWLDRKSVVEGKRVESGRRMTR